MIKTLSALGAIILLFGALAAIIGAAAFDEGSYEGLQVDGVSQADLLTAHTALIDYLSGDITQLDVKITWDGVYQDAFNAKTRLHMQDVRGLFDMRRWVQTWGLILGVVLIAPFIKKNRRDVGVGLIIGASVFALLLIALALWAILDFTAAFNAFHRAFFTNELWQMDPRTDLIIRMYPEALFAGIAAKIAAYTALIFVAVPGVGMYLSVTTKTFREDHS